MTRLARRSIPLLLAALVPLAQVQLFQPVVSAAQANVSNQMATEAALKGLKDQVDVLPLGSKMTVGEYLTTIHGNEFMMATLRRAQMIGGPRQLDDHTVQVRLDIAGKVVADALLQVATTNKHFSRYSPELISRESRVWSDRTFTATGVSSGGVAPTPATPMVASSEAPAQAVDAAKRSAAASVIAQVAQQPLPNNHKGDDFISLGGVVEALTTQVISQPVKSVEVRDAGEVRVTLTIDRQAFFDALKAAATRAGGVVVPADEAGWSVYREPVLAVVPPEVVGIAKPSQGTTVMPVAAQPGIPVTFATDRPPEWYFKQIDTGGSAAYAGSKLLTARAAESDALRLLRKELEDLPLDKSLTIGQAASRDPRVEAVLARAIERGRVFRVEYVEDGSVSVRVSTDTRSLWQDLVAMVSTGR